MMKVVRVVVKRAVLHDMSKFRFDESANFDLSLWGLKKMEYYSKEWKDHFNNPQVRKAAGLHRKRNSHHPEFWDDCFTPSFPIPLLDEIEMLCDWKASSLFSKDGSLERSMQINARRFAFTPNRVWSFRKTCEEIGIWPKKSTKQ